MKKAFIAVAAFLISLSLVITGCTGGGVAQEDYDALAAQLAGIQAQYNALQTDYSQLENENESLKARIAELEDKYVLTGDTTAETVANIARYYHETHEYSAADLFVCSDMAAEVWNMLKAQGINAIVAVGSVNRSLTDIIESDHAWVLAEVAPGEYLAVETTAGVVKTKDDNPLYYRGWYYASPAMIKDYQFRVKEYNTCVTIHNNIIAHDNEVIQLYNASANQTEADKYEAIHNKLTEIIHEIQADMLALTEKINNTATVLNM